MKKLIQDFEGVEYDEIKEENKNISNNHNLENKSSTKFGTSSKDKDSSNVSSNDSKGKENNIFGNQELDEKTGNSDCISFEEFCNIFKNIYESNPNPNKIFLEGFCYMDKDK